MAHTDRTNDARAMKRCLCTSGLSFGECCGPIISGERRAPTAEALMRSRFTAFAMGDADYLLATWHPRTRPKALELEEDIEWYRLDIDDVVDGNVFHHSGLVQFAARYRQRGVRGCLRERSRFERIDRRWFYVDGYEPALPA